MSTKEAGNNLTRSFKISNPQKIKIACVISEWHSEITENLFIGVNQEVTPQKLSHLYGGEDSMEVYDLDLCGIDVLWKITIEGNDGCFKKAGNLLLSLYRNVTTYNESTHKQFLDRCFKELRRKKSEGDESEDARTDLVREQSRVIFLLKF